MRYLNLLFLSLFAVAITHAAVELNDIPYINFIARSDYVVGNAKYNEDKFYSFDYGERNQKEGISDIDPKTLLSYQLGALGVRGEYLKLKNDANAPEEKENLQKYLIYTVVAEQIGDDLYNYIIRSLQTAGKYKSLEEAKTNANKVEFNELSEPVDLKNDTTSLQDLIGEEKVATMEKLLEKLLDDNVLEQYKLLPSIKGFWKKEILYINESTFPSLNDYLNYVYKFVVATLVDMTPSSKEAFIKELLQNVDGLKQKAKVNVDALVEEINSIKFPIEKIVSNVPGEGKEGIVVAGGEPTEEEKEAAAIKIQSQARRKRDAQRVKGIRAEKEAVKAGVPEAVKTAEEKIGIALAGGEKPTEEAGGEPTVVTPGEERIGIALAGGTTAGLTEEERKKEIEPEVKGVLGGIVSKVSGLFSKGKEEETVAAKEEKEPAAAKEEEHKEELSSEQHISSLLNFESNLNILSLLK